MDNLTIRTNSVVASLIAGNTIPECSRINRLARKKVVELHFVENYVHIIGEHSRKVIVPNKALKDSASLIAWMEDRISKAWSK